MRRFALLCVGAMAAALLSGCQKKAEEGAADRSQALVRSYEPNAADRADTGNAAPGGEGETTQARDEPGAPEIGGNSQPSR